MRSVSLPHARSKEREIGGAFGIKSSSVFDLLQALERTGDISERRNARPIVILDCKAAAQPACRWRTSRPAENMR